MSASVRDHFGVIGRDINGAVRRKRRRRLRARSDDHLKQDFSIRRDGLRRVQRWRRKIGRVKEKGGLFGRLFS